MSETSNAPETIWVTPSRYKGTDGNQTGTWGDWKIVGADEYTRTDAITPQQAAKVLVDKIQDDMAAANRAIDAMTGPSMDDPLLHWLSRCIHAIAEQEGE